MFDEQFAQSIGCLAACIGFFNRRERPRRIAVLLVEGTLVCELPLGSAQTWYLRWGDWFATLCVLVLSGWLAALALVARRNPREGLRRLWKGW